MAALIGNSTLESSGKKWEILLLGSSRKTLLVSVYDAT